MGNFIKWMKARAPKKYRFAYGGLILVLGVGVVYGVMLVLELILRGLPAPLRLIGRAYLLKTTFSIAGLDHAGRTVETALISDDLVEARRLLSWHLVSRETSELDAGQVAAAAIESLAENTSDSVIAPFFWYGLGGVSGAMVYRYLNTADAMLGYRDIEHEWLGKIPARVDDMMNLVPARLTGFLFVLHRIEAWEIWRDDAQLTTSPNAGHPMSAAAGVLGVQLEKVDHYTLNAAGRVPTVTDIKRMRGLMWRVCGVFLVGLLWLWGIKRDD